MRVLEKMENHEAEEDDDQEVAMMTKIVKRYFKNRNSRQPASSSSTPARSRDLKDYTSYNCQKKGHMDKTCTKPKVEVAENKALFSAWGMDDDESDLCEDFKGTCLMAHEETLPQVSSSPDFIKRLHVLGKYELINMIKELLEDSEVLEKEATEHAA